MSEARSGVTRWLSLGVVISVAFSCALELGMRIAGVGEVMVYAPDARFGYLMRPNQVVSTWGTPLRTNELGLRGPPLADPKPPGLVRVLFLGDSIAYAGGQLEDDQVFARRLEAVAAANGIRLEALNGSAPDWGPQNWDGWVGAVGGLGADSVVALIPAIHRARPFSVFEGHPMVAERPFLRLTIFWLKFRERFFQPTILLSDQALADNVSALQRLRARLAPAPLHAAFLPSRGGDTRPDRWQPYEAEFPDALDLRTAFRPEDFLDDVHLSARGHQHLAELLFARLRPELESFAAHVAGGVL
jgi:hypothetical protein